MDDLNYMVTQQQADIDILERHIDNTLTDVNHSTEITTELSNDNDINKTRYLYTLFIGLGVIILSLIK